MQLLTSPRTISSLSLSIFRRAMAFTQSVSSQFNLNLDHSQFSQRLFSFHCKRIIFLPKLLRTTASSWTWCCASLVQNYRTNFHCWHTTPLSLAVSQIQLSMIVSGWYFHQTPADLSLLSPHGRKLPSRADEQRHRCWEVKEMAQLHTYIFMCCYTLHLSLTLQIIGGNVLNLIIVFVKGTKKEATVAKVTCVIFQPNSKTSCHLIFELIPQFSIFFRRASLTFLRQSPLVATKLNFRYTWGLI